MDTFDGKSADNRPAGISGYLGRTGQPPHARAAMSAHAARRGGGATRPRCRRQQSAGIGFRTTRTPSGVESPMDVIPSI